METIIPVDVSSAQPTESPGAAQLCAITRQVTDFKHIPFSG
jgi:hypothetical protein